MNNIVVFFDFFLNSITFFSHITSFCAPITGIGTLLRTPPGEITHIHNKFIYLIVARINGHVLGANGKALLVLRLIRDVNQKRDACAAEASNKKMNELVCAGVYACVRVRGCGCVYVCMIIISP